MGKIRFPFVHMETDMKVIIIVIALLTVSHNHNCNPTFITPVLFAASDNYTHHSKRIVNRKNNFYFLTKNKCIEHKKLQN